jgi:hypothetical protein
MRGDAELQQILVGLLEHAVQPDRSAGARRSERYCHSYASRAGEEEDATDARATLLVLQQITARRTEGAVLHA